MGDLGNGKRPLSLKSVRDTVGCSGATVACGEGDARKTSSVGKAQQLAAVAHTEIPETGGRGRKMRSLRPVWAT